MSNVIFLDIDGVLNNIDSKTMWAAGNPATYGLDDHNVNNLLKLIKAVNAKVVLITGWRKFPEDFVWSIHGVGFNSPLKRVKTLLEDNGIDYDIASHSPHASKGDDVSDWLERNHCDLFAIIDDENRQGLTGFGEFFFRTDSNVGLTEENVNHIIKHFNEE